MPVTAATNRCLTISLRVAPLSLYPEGEIAEFLAFPWLFEKAELEIGHGLSEARDSRDRRGGKHRALLDTLPASTSVLGMVWAFAPLPRLSAGCDETSHSTSATMSPYSQSASAPRPMRRCAWVATAAMATRTDTSARLPCRVRPGSSTPTQVAEPAASPGSEEVVTVTTLDHSAKENRIDGAGHSSQSGCH